MISLAEAEDNNLEILQNAKKVNADVGILAQGRFHWCKINGITWDDMDDICSLKFIDSDKGNWSLPVGSITQIRVRYPNETDL